MGELLAHFERFNIFAFDLETTGLSPYDSRIVMAQFGFPNDEQFVVDARSVDLHPVLPFLRSQNWKKYYFNGKFDEQFMLHFYNTPIHNVWDAYIAERILYPEILGNQAFEDVALKYLNIKLEKDTRKSFLGGQTTPFTAKQIEYGAADVKHLFPVVDIQVGEIKKRNIQHIADLEMSLVTVIANMELTGVPIDKEMWRGVLAEYAQEHEESRKKLLELFGAPEIVYGKQRGLFDDEEKQLAHSDLNLGSPAQVTKAFASLGVFVESTKDQVISLIRHPAAEELTKYRGLDKIMTSYGEKAVLDKIHPFTGRIHANWKQIGTETGRFSCSQPNLQQIPQKFRACVGGSGDYVLLGADFSQMELRILAQESKDPVLVDAFTTGKDIHTVTATMMFGIPAEKVTKEQRFAAKTLNFGITYGMKIKKFTDMLNIEEKKNGRQLTTMPQAQRMMTQYKETYKTAARYLEQSGLFALREGYAETRFGRRRKFNPASTSLGPKAYKGQIEAIKREGANMPIQGTNADITKMAMVELHSELRDYGFKANIILQVHDELVVLTHKSQAEMIKEIVVDSMTTAGQRLLPDIPVVVDAYTSEYWNK